VIPTTTTTPVSAVLAGVTVVIDPGHNGRNWAHPDEIGRLVDVGNGTKSCNTTGTSTVDGYTEAEFNWSVAGIVVERLERAGATVLLTRSDNEGWGPCITERAATGNRAGADAVISIHADGGPEDGRGFHVIYPASLPGLTDDIATESRRLAEALHAAYLDTGMPVADYLGESGFSERDDLGGLNLSDVPAVFLEAGNMRNATDAALLKDPGFQGAIADAIVRAVVGFVHHCEVSAGPGPSAATRLIHHVDCPRPPSTPED
jgi:N-acetylmuramoyl-L-alanine amidase